MTAVLAALLVLALARPRHRRRAEPPVQPGARPAARRRRLAAGRGEPRRRRSRCAAAAALAAGLALAAASLWWAAGPHPVTAAPGASLALAVPSSRCGARCRPGEPLRPARQRRRLAPRLGAPRRRLARPRRPRPLPRRGRGGRLGRAPAEQHPAGAARPRRLPGLRRILRPVGAREPALRPDRRGGARRGRGPARRRRPRRPLGLADLAGRRRPELARRTPPCSPASRSTTRAATARCSQARAARCCTWRRRAGWSTAAVMPAITLPWPEAGWFGYDTRARRARDLGYRRPAVQLGDDARPVHPGRARAPAARPRPAPPGLRRGRADLLARALDADPADAAPGRRSATAGSSTASPRPATRRRWSGAIPTGCANSTGGARLHAARRRRPSPSAAPPTRPLLVVLGDHQPAAFVSGDPEGRDVPVHLIGPPELLARLDAEGWSPGLLPAADAPVIPMQALRDRLLAAFAAPPPAGRRRCADLYRRPSGAKVLCVPLDRGWGRFDGWDAARRK